MADRAHLDCLDGGGHYWLPQVPGERNTCRECGYRGLVFEPMGAAARLDLTPLDPSVPTEPTLPFPAGWVWRGPGDNYPSV